MIARYAYMISQRTNTIQCDLTDRITSETRYLNTVIYPLMSAAMWKGAFHFDLLSSRLTAGIAAKLRDDGFVIRRSDAGNVSALHTRIEWGLQKIWSEEGATEWVSSRAYNEWCDQFKADYDLDPRDKEDQRTLGLDDSVEEPVPMGPAD